MTSCCAQVSSLVPLIPTLTSPTLTNCGQAGSLSISSIERSQGALYQQEEMCLLIHFLSGPTEQLWKMRCSTSRIGPRASPFSRQTARAPTMWCLFPGRSAPVSWGWRVESRLFTWTLAASETGSSFPFMRFFMSLALCMSIIGHTGVSVFFRHSIQDKDDFTDFLDRTQDQSKFKFRTC